MQWTNLSTHMCHNAIESGVQCTQHRNFLFLRAPHISIWPNECGCICSTSTFDALHLKNPFTDVTISSPSRFFLCHSTVIYCESLSTDFMHVKCCLYCTLHAIQMDRMYVMHAIYCDNGMTNTYSFLLNVIYLNLNNTNDLLASKKIFPVSGLVDTFGMCISWYNFPLFFTLNVLKIFTTNKNFSILFN